MYPRLAAEYQIGMPDTGALRASLLTQFESGLSRFHDAGVAHLDLYLSNIMWKEISPTEVKLKFIDWDSAHFIEEKLSTEVELRLSQRRAAVARKAARDDGHAVDHVPMRYYDLSLLYVLRIHIDDAALQARDKATLDAACIDIQLDYTACAPLIVLLCMMVIV